jgi:hypothetical protein
MFEKSNGRLENNTTAPQLIFMECKLIIIRGLKMFWVVLSSREQ